MKQDESNGDPKFTIAIGFKSKSLSYRMRNKRQSWKWKGVCENYKNPILDLMLDKWVLKTEERPIGHKSFLPQEGGRCEIWIGGLKKRHSYRRWYPWREM